MNSVIDRIAMTSRRAVIAAAAAVLSVAVVGLPTANAVEKADISIGIGPDWGTSGHAVIALQKGYFAEEGLNVELKRFSAGLVQVEALAAGDLDFAVPAQAPVFSLRSAGIPILFLANTTIYYEALSLVMRKDANVTEATDLVGRKIGVFKGSGAELMYRAILSHYGIDAKDVQAIGLKPPEQLSSIISGSVDGIVVWEPWVSQAVEKADGVKVHTGGTSHFAGNDGEQVIVDWTRAVLTTLEPMVEDNPETVDAVMRAFVKAHDFLTNPANKAEAVKLFSEYQEQDEAFNSAQFDSFEFSLALDEGFLDGMNRPLDFLESIGRVKKRIDVLDYTYAEPLRKVRPDLVSIEPNYSR